MVTALCFITAEPSRVNEVGSTIAQLPQVKVVYSVTGDLDLVAMVRVHGLDDVSRVVTDQVARIEGIRGTETHIAFRTHSRHDLEAAFSLGAG